jgi:hypothetical protein
MAWPAYRDNNVLLAIAHVGHRSSVGQRGQIESRDALPCPFIEGLQYGFAFTPAGRSHEQKALGDEDAPRIFFPVFGISIPCSAG